MLLHYSFDAKSLSASEREELIGALDRLSETGCSVVNPKKFLFTAFFEESVDVRKLPIPSGTIIARIS